jgi:drug/metabolite transporter (DMT)-like permease
MSTPFHRQQSHDLETLPERSQLLQEYDHHGLPYGTDAEDDDEDVDDEATTTTFGTYSQRSIDDAASYVGTIVGTITEEVEHLMESVTEVASEVKESIVGEIIEVKEAFIDELHEADEGEDFFLEMALTRHLSILPGDVVEAAAATEVDIGRSDSLEDETLDGKAGSGRIPPSAYLLLMSAVISLSSIGPFLDLQTGVGAIMKMYWRMSGTALLLAPAAIYAMVYKNGVPRLTKAQWVTFSLAAACYTVLCNGFVLALEYTTVGNAVILSNSQALLLLLGKAFVGAPIQLLEGGGALLAFGGALLCSKDSNDSSSSGDIVDSSSTLYGDLLAIASALGGVGYLIFAKTIRPHMNLFVFMFSTMFLGSIFTALFMILTKLPYSFDRDVNTGFFGWMNTSQFDRLPLELITVVVCNLMGTMGYVRAMKDFDNLIISVAALMEPVVATFIAYGLHVGSLPGVFGWIGNFLVALGTFGVVYPTATAKHK